MVAIMNKVCETRRVIRPAIIVANSVVVVLSCAIGNGFQKAQPETHADVIVAAELVKQVDEVGLKLERIVADPKQSESNRATAAELLGRLRYTPAIPTLIRFRKWVLPGHDTDTFIYPCMDALVLFGDAATPLIVRAWLDESNGSDAIRFVSVFESAKTGGHALILERAFADAEKDAKVRDRYRSKVRFLAESLMMEK